MEVALNWQSKGASSLHIVDLDGAASGETINFDIINEIASAVLIPVQVGGGIRHLKTIEKLLRAGVERVILGTAAVENPTLVSEACSKFPDSIVVAIDARNGYIAIHGWQHNTELEAKTFAVSMKELGIRSFIYTDVNRNATLTEPNFSAIFEIMEAIRLPIVASGGISSLLHLKMLAKLGTSGAIVGKALYSGDVKFKQALQVINEEC